MAYEHNIDSDLRSAVEYNPGNLDLMLVDSVIAAIYGENDEADWYWVLKMKDDTYGLARGGCDYTGWDCRSSLTLQASNTLAEALALAPKRDSYGRAIQTALQKQINGKEPFGVINGEDH